MKNILMKKFTDRKARVAVVGLGYVGLPLAVEIADKGFEVFGIDICKSKVDFLNSGRSYILDIDDSRIKDNIGKDLFIGDDFSVIAQADAITICVPTPLNETKEPDLSYIKSVMNNIVGYFQKGTLVILESTTYPGATEELVTRFIEEKLKLRVGEDFFVCYSPERIDPSNKSFNVKNTPKLIGGTTSACLELGIALYSNFIDKIIPVSSTKVAEMAKLLENTFRSVNLALINELTMMSESMKINIWEVIDAAASKPFGFMAFYPGIGVGGHCLPIDPLYLSWKAKTFDYFNRFIELTTEINENMPNYAVNQIGDILNNIEKSIKNSRIMIMGLGYKKDTDDLRESPSLKLFQLLKEKGANVMYHDPYVPSCRYKDETIFSQELTRENLQTADIVVVATDNSNIDYQFVIDNSKIVYDTRNVTKDYEGKNIILLGGHRGCIKGCFILGEDNGE